MAEEQGVQAVTIRQVAKRLGVTPMALYWHFTNKDDLLDGMVDWLHGEIDFSLDESASWQDQLRTIIDAEIAVLRAYSETARLLRNRGSTSRNSLLVVETTLNVLRRAGFSPHDASQVMKHLDQMLISLADDSREQRDRQRQVQAKLQPLSPERFPNIVEAAEHLNTRTDPNSYYAFAVDLLMAGIEAMALRTITEDD